ncbi:MAG: DNA replication/repair protein RecF [Oscillospiraceae bacterium]|nr:DNA replication/repair protein RecF [Oscillospiraceae bacterium]
MLVHNIHLEGFRNYDRATARFADNVNVITGRNAQGKTNLLEGLYFLAGGKSFRSRFDREIIGFNRDSAVIKADITSGGRQQNIEIRLNRGRKKQIFVNSVKLKTAAELSGRMTAVIFCPDDLYLIKSGAAARRRLMDMCLCQLRPRYAAALADYNRLYEDKSRILKDWREKPSLLDALDEFNLQMCYKSAQIIYYRANFARLLSEHAARIHRDFSGGGEELSVRYQTMKTVSEPTRAPKELLGEVIEHQRSHKSAEIDSGMCLSGIHKDDLLIDINGSPAKSYASQGQTRTAALSLKLAEREIHMQDAGEYPILLLDDVLSELDAGRQDFVLNMIGQGQVFITCCEDENIASRTGGRVITVEDGRIIQGEI